MQLEKESQNLVALPISLIERILIKHTNAILEEFKTLHTKHTQTKARLQTFRESFSPHQWESFLISHPQAKNWFNKDNIPI